jgi:hypothetical protein
MGSKKDDKVGAHGLTRREMKDLQRAQAVGLQGEIKMIPGNGPDAGSYMLPEYEKDLVHVELEIPQFDQTTGERKSKPSTQKFGVNEFEAMKQHNGFAGYTTKILNSPEYANAQLGVAAQGVRKVDSNYAAMQDRYEALTGVRPDAGLTPFELNAANLAAEAMLTRLQGSQLKPIDESQAEPHNPPVILGTPVAAALIPEQLPVAETPEAAKALAAMEAMSAAANTPPTGDGTTSVGQETETAAEVKTQVDANSSQASNSEANTQPSADAPVGAGTPAAETSTAATTTKRGRPVAASKAAGVA